MAVLDSKNEGLPQGAGPGGLRKGKDPTTANGSASNWPAKLQGKSLPVVHNPTTEHSGLLPPDIHLINQAALIAGFRGSINQVKPIWVHVHHSVLLNQDFGQLKKRENQQIQPQNQEQPMENTPKIKNRQQRNY